jgi:hypothetical protein
MSDVNVSAAPNQVGSRAAAAVVGATARPSSSVDAFSIDPLGEFAKLQDRVSAMHVFFNAVHQQSAQNVLKERLRGIIGREAKAAAQAKEHFRQGVLKLGTLTSRNDVAAIGGHKSVRMLQSLMLSLALVNLVLSCGWGFILVVICDLPCV